MLRGCGIPAQHRGSSEAEEGTELPDSAWSYETRGSLLLFHSSMSVGTSGRATGGQGQDGGFSWSQALSEEGGRGDNSDDVPGWKDVKEVYNISEQPWALSPSLTG